MAELTNNKPNVFLTIWNNSVKFFKEIKSEVKKIIWPTKKDIYNGTVITISATLIIGIFIWSMGWLIYQGIAKIIGY